MGKRVFFTTLEYGARVLGVILLVVGFMAGCSVGCGYVVGVAVEDPFPLTSGQYLVSFLPFLGGVGLYILSGVFKALAEED